MAALESVRNTKTGDIEDFRCIVVNPITAQVFNLEPEDLIGKLVFRRFISKINPQLFPAFVQVVETGKALEKDIRYTVNNNTCWYHFIAVKLGDGFSVTVRDITERKKLELKLNKLATFDGLTKVYNRQSFDQNLSKEWTRGAREKQPLSLIICDVDYFKPYNDFYGHIQGDKCLKKVAKIMAEIVKRSSDFLARYGGEEFAIILPNTPLTGALTIAETLRLTVENLAIPHAQSEISPVITISLGVSSTIPDANLPFDTLVRGADLALYEAKNQGRNCVVNL
ncbi:MAG: sensor domain-containing diguanylate cyclase [Cyanobacterium sp. T60_A2020_053]|nr:sensor domain-containing diguanylate cyclase [Cyanobacterium sp. T60_A2020_053]